MADFAPSLVSQGNPATFTDTLRDAAGVVVDLTGCAVMFTAQSGSKIVTRAATLVTPTGGTVSVTTLVGDMDTPGKYQAQWTVTFPDARVVAYPVPGGVREFEITALLPVIAPAEVSLLAEFHEPVRAILGDLHPKHKRYQADSIDAVLRTVVRLGRVPGVSLTPNQRGVTPVISSPRQFGLLTYHAAKIFLLPDVASKSYKLRAISESFGEQKHFLFDLENALFDLTNGDGGVFVTFQTFYGWINSLTGLNLFEALTELKTNAPVATATIGRDGLQLNI